MDVNCYRPFGSRPKVVIFDLCGTLMDSKQLDHEAINYTLRQYNKEPWHITRSKKDKLKSMKNNFPNFFGKNYGDAYKMYIDYLTKNINSVNFFDCVSEHLQVLQSAGIKTAVITNRDKLFIGALDNHKEYVDRIRPYLNLLLTADEAKVTKPSPKIIDCALERLGISNINSKDIIFVGDAFADMQAAIDYNCTPILLTATTADITDDFLSKNESKIYLACSHKEIITSFIENDKQHSNTRDNHINNPNIVREFKTR